MFRMQRLALFLIIFVFLAHPLLGAEEISLALDEAIGIALRENRDILLKSEDIKKAKAEIAEAQAGLFPTLDFTGGWQDKQEYYPQNLAQTTTQTTLKQYLYRGGKTLNSIAQNRYKLEVSAALLDKAKLETILNVKKAFYTLLLASELSGLNKNILANINGHFNFIEARYKNGQASDLDILDIKASLGNAREAYEAALNEVEATQAVLKNLLYLDEGVRIIPYGAFTYEPRELAYDEAFLKAIRMRPEIRQFEAQAKADKKAIEVIKADNRPNIYASWDYYSSSHLAATSSKNWNDYNVFGFTFSWPIFDGWETKAKVEQAIIDLKQTQLLKEKAVKDIALELKNSYLALKDALVKIEAVESDLKFYSDNLSSIKERYSQGIASHLDMDDAVLKYEVSVFNQKQAVYDYIIAKSSFDKATGGV